MDEATFQEAAKRHRHIALFREISADHITPIQAFAALSGHCLLESAAEDQLGRHSYVGADPLFSLIDPPQGFGALKEFRKSFNCAVDHPLALYTGGLVGFVAYDAIRLQEKIPDRHCAQKELPDLLFHCYKTNAIFDHRKHRLVLSHIVTADTAYADALAALDAIEEKLFAPRQLLPMKRVSGLVETPDLADEAYQEIVRAAKVHIERGDLFQMVPSRTFSMPCAVSGLEVYRALRQISPAPYLFFFDLGATQIAGASPEKLISVQKGIVSSTPIAGTRPIDGDPSELLFDPKEIAEHMMLVDLARNDLGAVCKVGSVEVKKLLEVQKFSHVMHIVSLIEGELREGLDAIDAFKASFPAGTLTGAPKIRAMELIDAMEGSRRGLYGGAIVALDAAGNLDSCIAIRMAMVKEGMAQVRTGAGVVYDSDPQREAQETKDKARSVLEAIQFATGARHDSADR